jgi:ketosteroid isomerase-like protein
MAQENVEFVRQRFAAYNRADVNAMLEGWAADAVVDWSNSRGLEARVYRGQDEIRAFFERFVGTFESVRMELIGDPLEVADGVVIAENVAYLQGRETIELQARSTFLIRIRDGEQTSLTLYQTKREALEAAGLSDTR